MKLTHLLTLFAIICVLSIILVAFVQTNSINKIETMGKSICLNYGNSYYALSLKYSTPHVLCKNTTTNQIFEFEIEVKP